MKDDSIAWGAAGLICGLVIGFLIAGVFAGKAIKNLNMELQLERRYSDWITNRAVNAETRLREIEKEKL